MGLNIFNMANKGKKSLVCTKCQKNITKLHYKIQYAGNCSQWFHKDCSGLTNEEFSEFELRTAPQKWACSVCSIIEATKVKEANPINTISRRSSIGIRSKSPVQQEVLAGGSNESCNTFDSYFDVPSPTNHHIMLVIRKMYEDLKSSVTFNGSIMEDMKATIQSLVN